MPLTPVKAPNTGRRNTRRWQFRLYQLLVFVTILCLTMAWWMNRRSLIRELTANGAATGTDWGAIGSRWDFVNNNVSSGLAHTIAADGDVTYITLRGDRFNDDWLPRLRRCPKLDSLHLVEAPISNTGLSVIDELPTHLSGVSLYSCMGVSDGGLRYLKRQRSISWLHLDAIDLNGEGLRYLVQLPNLTTLGLENCTALNGSNLAHLQECKKLELLYLNGSAIVDANLEVLLKLPSLKEVQLSRTNVTPAGIARLKTAAPQLSVVY